MVYNIPVFGELRPSSARLRIRFTARCKAGFFHVSGGEFKL